jgi:hypothetical protein
LHLQIKRHDRSTENAQLIRAVFAPGGNRLSIGPGSLWVLGKKKAFFFYNYKYEGIYNSGGAVINATMCKLLWQQFISRAFQATNLSNDRR